MKRKTHSSNSGPELLLSKPRNGVGSLGSSVRSIPLVLSESQDGDGVRSLSDDVGVSRLSSRSDLVGLLLDVDHGVTESEEEKERERSALGRREEKREGKEDSPIDLGETLGFGTGRTKTDGRLAKREEARGKREDEEDVRLDQHTGGDGPRAGGRVDSEVLKR